MYMKIVIISDIHDNLVNLDKCLEWCGKNKISKLLCLGDVTNAETLGRLAESFNGPIYLVRGNMEIYEESEAKKYNNINYLGRYGLAQFEEIKAGLCHEPKFVKEVMALDPMLYYVFYGHTHKPWLEKDKGVTIINPGTLGGVFQKATFAVWNLPEPGQAGEEDEKIELILLESLKEN
jgi:hypothetical protein